MAININEVKSALTGAGFVELHGYKHTLTATHCEYFSKYLIELNGQVMHSYASISSTLKKITQLITELELREVTE